MRLASSPVRSLVGAAIGTLLALSSMSARADFQSDITVKLIAPGGVQGDPTPIGVSQVVTTANLATGIVSPLFGGSGDVSNYLADNEHVFFSGDSIRVRSYSGTDAFTTGYVGLGGEHARYEFDDLSIAGKTITGFTVYAFDNFLTSGYSGLASPLASDLVNLIDPHTVSLDLDNILFNDRGTGSSFAHADFRIDLITQDSGGNGGGNSAPEPATLALLAIAALGARAARRHA
ncbi:PEP-CTERM sorting domain-containing protein [Roseateles saccharophilus]|uniref:Putative secreted protein with PEP-CTERM sorting signal n=1 Tax=Roseateles saccharophilus TaxID=304 RepID=A0A4R3V1J5_ROSSA|nr:PEP-CTERM sorting domain-containing protein [Roseateles saccharophilus]MDG0835339.1 PEP-CTERM sorting domain-containing protein [Roseateles saccharophilus]TCU96144.1 putative secreted protein with PEP-CTERM sorting signal [Roseateles saccharophilus]